MLLRMLHALIDGALALLYPRGVACAACSAPLNGDEDGVLCPSCMDALARLRCPVFPNAVPEPLDFRDAACAFSGVSRELVHRFKYDGHIRLAPFMAHEMRRAVPDGVDFLVPVPLHPRRQAARGYNQSFLLAQEISARSGPPCLCALRRVRFTRQQARLTRRSRQQNMRHSMLACEDVRGKRLLLIDDVFTTGSTACEAARALKKAGASWVGVLTFAKA